MNFMRVYSVLTWVMFLPGMWAWSWWPPGSSPPCYWPWPWCWSSHRQTVNSELTIILTEGVCVYFHHCHCQVTKVALENSDVTFTQEWCKSSRITIASALWAVNKKLWVYIFCTIDASAKICWENFHKSLFTFSTKEWGLSWEDEVVHPTLFIHHLSIVQFLLFTCWIWRIALFWDQGSSHIIDIIFSSYFVLFKMLMSNTSGFNIALTLALIYLK